MFKLKFDPRAWLLGVFVREEGAVGGGGCYNTATVLYVMLLCFAIRVVVRQTPTYSYHDFPRADGAGAELFRYRRGAKR